MTPRAVPFLLERAYGDGKVALWTSSLDRAWNRVPDSPGTFVPLVLELVQDLGARFQQERNLAVGSGPRARGRQLPPRRPR